MIKKHLISAILFSAMVSPAAMATTTSVITSDFVGAPYTEQGLLAQKVGPTNGYYAAKWGPDTTSVWTSNDANTDIGSQSAANVWNWVASTSGYVGTLDLVSFNDSIGGGSTGSFNFGSSLANFVALHYGNKESLFYFANGISQFDLNFIQGNLGLSNYRAYGTSPPIIPLPAAAWLFGSALLGFVALSNRRRV